MLMFLRVAGWLVLAGWLGVWLWLAGGRLLQPWLPAVDEVA
jgi:hypothetical protein